jgi:hypothetical protein
MIIVTTLCMCPVLVVYYIYGLSPEVAFNKKKMDLNLKNKLLKFYIWSIALFGAESWTPQKLSQKCL